MTQYINYEYPLNEKIRLFLRIEYLWQRIEHSIQNESDENCLYWLQNVLNLMEINDRFDLRSDVIKHLDRLLIKFYKIHTEPNVDLEKLQHIIDNINSTMNSLKNIRGKVAFDLSKNEWLAVIRQKMMQPGGISLIDLPFLKFWLQFPLTTKIKQLIVWQEDFVIIIKAINLILYYIRKSTIDSEITAKNGSYQNIIDSKNEPNIILLKIAKVYNIYPEISGNRYRFVVRFLQNRSGK